MVPERSLDDRSSPYAVARPPATWRSVTQWAAIDANCSATASGCSAHPPRPTTPFRDAASHLTCSSEHRRPRHAPVMALSDRHQCVPRTTRSRHRRSRAHPRSDCLTPIMGSPESQPDVVAPGDAEPDALLLAKESLSQACFTLLALLTCRQRAVLILRDVLRWSASNTATLLGTSAAAVDSARTPGPSDPLCDRRRRSSSLPRK